jgi:hypothetical protein
VTSEAERIQAAGTALSPEAVAWLLNREHVDAGADVPLTAEQLVGLASVESLAAWFNAAPYDFERLQRKELLCQYDAAANTTVANTIRLGCGGELPNIPPDLDPVSAQLARLAIDYYSWSLHTEPPAYGGMIRQLPATYRHPASLLLQEAILADHDLRQLFPDAPPDPNPVDVMGYGHQSSVLWSSGAGGSLAINQLPNSMTYYTLVLASLHGLPVTEVPRFAAEVADCCRRLARGQWTNTAFVVGVANLELGPELQVEFPGLSLVPVKRSRWLVPVLDGACTSAAVGYLGLKLLKVWPHTVTVEEQDPTWRHGQRLFDAHSLKRGRAVDRALLSILLTSTDADNVAAPLARGRISLNPLSGGGLGWSGAVEVGVPHASMAITPERAASAVAIHAQTKLITERLWFGVRRLLSAATGRTNPIDSFVDAVISWENVFGSDREITNAISMSIAHLLEPDSARARHVLFQRIKELYDLRSKILHGRKEPSPTEAQKLRLEATWIGIQIFQRLLPRPALMKLESGKRVQALLLGDQEPSVPPQGEAHV